MHSRVADANSVWIVRCTFASVSTSTLLVASSCVFRKGSANDTESEGRPYQNDDAAVLHERPAQREQLLLPSAVIRTCGNGRHEHCAG